MFIMTLARKRRPSYADVVASNSAKTAETLKSNVKVVVRIRPESRQEVNKNSRCVVKAMNEHVLVFDPLEQSTPEYGYKNRHRQPRDIRKRQCKDMKFAFDYVYGPKSTSNDVYETTTKQILDGLLDGYNCSVFAYGATGAGKTHTMLGNQHQPGVIYLTMMDLYARMKAMEAEKTCDVAVSYLEVYNEQIRDLLVRGSFLPVRETPDSGVVIQGLSLHKPKTAEELLHMLRYGNENRTQHPTDANAESSRSHAVFQVYARQKDRTANISAEMRVAKMCLVDLAGSERATVTKNRGTRFREGANINRSLLALGNVINALADSKSKGHVPYRDSKLTRLLKDSLGGNCQTIMIAAVSPSSLSYEDTYNTLKYADRAKHIQASLKKNVMNIDFHVTRYGKIVEELRQEIVELKAKVQMYEVGKGNGMSTQQLVNPEITRMKQKLESVYSARLGICREVLDSELKTRDLMWKIMRKERCLSRMSVFCEAHHGAKSRIQQMISASQQRCKSLQEAKKDKMPSLYANTETLEQLKSSVYEQDQNDIAVQTLKINQQLHQASLSLTESQYCIKYLTKVVKAQERELAGSERLTIQLLQVVKQQHRLLKHHDLLTSDLETYYENIQTMVEGREVCFADQNESVLISNGIAVSDVLDLKSLATDTSNLSSASSSIQHTVASSSDIVITNVEQGPKRVYMNKTAFHPSTAVPEKTSWCNGNSKVSLSDTVADKSPWNSNRKTAVHCLSETLLKKEHNNLTGPSSDIQTFTSSERCGGKNSSCKRTAIESTPYPKTSLVHNQHKEIIIKNVLNSCIDSSPSTNKISQSVQTLSGAHTNSRDTAAGQPNCLAINTSALLSQSQKHPLEQNAISSLSHVQSFGSIQKSLAKYSPGLVVDKPVISSTSVSGQSNGQVVKNEDVVVTSCIVDNQDLNSTFTVQEGYRENPCVGSKTPVTGNKYTSIRHNGQTASCNTIVNSQICTKENSHNEKEVICLSQNEQSNVVCLQNSINCVEVLPSSNLDTSTQEAIFINSQTITKDNPCIGNGDTKPINKGHCVRSLAFEEICTPQTGRSYAAVAATPPLTRKPLCHLNVNTTPLATPMTQASPQTSDDKENCPISKGGSSKSFYGHNLWDEQTQRNAKNLHRMGMLSVTDRENKNITDQSKNTPSYMKMTKSANQRSKFKSRLYHRSDAVSSLPRPGWQH